MVPKKPQQEINYGNIKTWMSQQQLYKSRISIMSKTISTHFFIVHHLFTVTVIYSGSRQTLAHCKGQNKLHKIINKV